MSGGALIIAGSSARTSVVARSGAISTLSAAAPVPLNMRLRGRVMSGGGTSGHTIPSLTDYRLTRKGLSPLVLSAAEKLGRSGLITPALGQVRIRLDLSGARHSKAQMVEFFRLLSEAFKRGLLIVYQLLGSMSEEGKSGYDMSPSGILVLRGMGIDALGESSGDVSMIIGGIGAVNTEVLMPLCKLGEHDSNDELEAVVQEQNRIHREHELASVSLSWRHKAARASSFEETIGSEMIYFALTDKRLTLFERELLLQLAQPDAAISLGEIAGIRGIIDPEFGFTAEHIEIIHDALPRLINMNLAYMGDADLSRAFHYDLAQARPPKEREPFLEVRPADIRKFKVYMAKLEPKLQGKLMPFIENYYQGDVEKFVRAFIFNLNWMNMSYPERQLDIFPPVLYPLALWYFANKPSTERALFCGKFYYIGIILAWSMSDGDTNKYRNMILYALVPFFMNGKIPEVHTLWRLHQSMSEVLER